MFRHVPRQDKAGAADQKTLVVPDRAVPNMMGLRGSVVVKNFIHSKLGVSPNRVFLEPLLFLLRVFFLLFLCGFGVLFDSFFDLAQTIVCLLCRLQQRFKGIRYVFRTLG